MPPSKTPFKGVALADMLNGRSVVLCPGLSADNPSFKDVGLLSAEQHAELFEPDADQTAAKALLGRRLAEMPSLNVIGRRGMGSLRPIIDETGRMRCPPGTPNANQFTNLQLIGCMDMPGSRSMLSPRDITSGAPGMKFSRRSASIARREQMVLQKHGPLDTRRQRVKALARAFPSARIDFRNPLYTQITPTARRRAELAERSFVIGLLAEADAFPDVAAKIGQITNLLRGRSGRQSSAVTELDGRGQIGIHMSPFFSSWLGEQVSSRAIQTARRKGNMKYDSFLSNGIDENTPEAEKWHHTATHEFGHVVDISKVLEDVGFTLEGTGASKRWVKTRAASDPEVEKTLQKVYANDIAGLKTERQRFDAFLRHIMIDRFFNRKLGEDEAQRLFDALKSQYALAFAEQSDSSIVEFIPELYAHARISGLDEFGQDAPRLREILQQYTGKDITPAGQRPMSRRSDASSVSELRLRSQRAIDNGWSDDDWDEEILGPRPKPKPTKRPSWGFNVGPEEDEPEKTRQERFEANDPLSLPRRGVPIQGMTISQFIRLYDEAFDAMQDMMSKLDDDDDVERNRKRIAKLYFNMQLLQKHMLMRQDGDKLVLHLTEDNLKRLYKGFEAMIAQGYWSDDEKVKELFAEIKRLYRQSFSSFPSVEVKKPEEKSAVRRMVGGMRGLTP